MSKREFWKEIVEDYAIIAFTIGIILCGAFGLEHAEGVFDFVVAVIASFGGAGYFAYLMVTIPEDMAGLLEKLEEEES